MNTFGRTNNRTGERTRVPDRSVSGCSPRVVFVDILCGERCGLEVEGSERRWQRRVDWVLRVATTPREARIRVRVCPIASGNLASYCHTLAEPQARLPHVAHAGTIRTVAAPSICPCTMRALSRRTVTVYGCARPCGTHRLGRSHLGSESSSHALPGCLDTSAHSSGRSARRATICRQPSVRPLCLPSTAASEPGLGGARTPSSRALDHAHGSFLRDLPTALRGNGETRLM